MLVVIIKLLLLSLLQYSDLVLLCFFPVQLGYTLDEIKSYLKNSLKPGTAVLFKGSRGMRLNEAADGILEA